MVKYFKQFSLQQEYEMNLHGVWEGVKVRLSNSFPRILLTFASFPRLLRCVL